METIPDFQDDDDGGLNEFERFEWEWRHAELLLMDDPHYDDWLDYTQEQNSHVH